MASKQRIYWSKMAAEALLVIGSILVALILNEWRTGFADRGLEREYLDRLKTDLQANLDVIATLHRAQQSQITNANLVYPFIVSGDWNGLNIASMVRASYLATPSPTPIWIDDTFEELKSTGRMSLLRNSSLRAAILAYHRFLESSDYTYELMSTDYRDAVRERMDPQLQIRLRSECRPRVASCNVSVACPDLEGFVKWLSGNEILAQGLRRVILQWTRGEEEYLPDVEERTQELIGLVKEELKR